MARRMTKKEKERARLEKEAEKTLALRREAARMGLIDPDPEEIPDKPLYAACATGNVNDIMRALGMGR